MNNYVLAFLSIFLGSSLFAMYHVDQKENAAIRMALMSRIGLQNYMPEKDLTILHVLRLREPGTNRHAQLVLASVAGLCFLLKTYSAHCRYNNCFGMEQPEGDLQGLLSGDSGIWCLEKFTPEQQQRSLIIQLTKGRDGDNWEFIPGKIEVFEPRNPASARYTFSEEGNLRKVKVGDQVLFDAGY
jgi:hypothetical protein